MNIQPDKPKRFRPRFSVRTLAILVTLVCGYLGFWEPTKTWGIPAVPVPDYETSRLTSPCPFLIVKPETAAITNLVAYSRGAYDRHYYVWFFGYVARLPADQQSEAGREVDRRMKEFLDLPPSFITAAH